MLTGQTSFWLPADTAKMHLLGQGPQSLQSVIVNNSNSVFQQVCTMQAAEDLVVWDYETLLTEVASEVNADRTGLMAAQQRAHAR